MPDIGVPRGFLTAAGLTAATIAYLDARLHLGKDLRLLARSKQAERNFARAIQNKKASGFFLFEEAVKRHPDAVCIWSRQGEYTWAQTYARACQYGWYFKSRGLKSFEFVAVYLYNSPDFLFMWMGLLSIGAAPALINYNLASEALVHCIRISGAKILIYDSAEDCVARISGSQQQLGGLSIDTIRLTDDFRWEISQFPETRPIVDAFENATGLFSVGLFYTSGTTGLPKAFSINADRSYPAASLKEKSFGQISGPGGDRSYYCVPIYHGTGGLSIMNELMAGIAVAIAPKFSASRFWMDCIDIGELVRYLLAAPPTEYDRLHHIRLAWGNGMSPELWERFQNRFGVAEIGEFYASTEGMFALGNLYRGGPRPKSVGHHGWLLRHMYRNSIIPVYVDPETDDIWRDAVTGFAKRVPYDQGGEIVCKLESRAAWTGYFGAEAATRKKLVKDLFEEGDLYYRTGDALRRDDDGHWFFVDRLGDTYRWKGENVSTTEVTQVLGAHHGILEPNVYGVEIPSHDGRAGCAAIVLKDSSPESFDWTSLASHLRSELPSYAVPIFMRVVNGIGRMSTANHKHNKVHLRQEGVDPASLGTKVANGEHDRIFWLPSKSAKYVELTSEDWKAVTKMKARI